MSGHSKWATIKRKKAIIDSKRGKAFTKLIKEITVAARVGGGDPDANPRLRTLVEKSKALNMPVDNTMRAIKKGTGELPGASYEPFSYEGYGPHGIAVIIDTLSDNKNRTVAELRHLFSVKSGSLGESGSVNWMFERMGVIQTKGEKGITEDTLLENLLDYEINDISTDEDNYFSIQCNPKSLDLVKQAVEKLGLKVESAEIEWVPKTTMDLSDEQSTKALEFLSALEDLDDVQEVYTNLA
ncbi:MAG: YebC/PmpR family DNA-binding transcriptional regulator [Candidatus Dependentiae bacterium]|nr:YebC/PmpR family DNA-binding transcriptional regulator [Candidatus Dependentiae bacterium]